MKTLRPLPAMQFKSWRLILPAAILFAFILGLAAAVLPLQILLITSALFVIAPMYVWRPAWLMVPVIAAQMYLPSQPVADVITVIYLARAAVTLAARWQAIVGVFSAILLRPVYVIALCAIASFAVAVAVLQHGKSPVYQDGRVLIYWLWLIPFIAFAPPDRPARWIATQLMGVAIIVALLAIVQGALGITLVPTGRISQLETLGQYNVDVFRVQIPGFVFVTFGIFLSAAQLVKRGVGPWWWFHFALMLLFTVAVIYNFGRAIWFWTVLGLLITALLMGWRSAVKLGVWAVAAALLLGFGLAATKPQLMDSMVTRVTSVFSEGGGRTSYGWREVENSNARRVLAESMLLGTALGGDYRPPEFGLRGFDNHTRYIHNGHLSLMLKLSVVGYLAYVALFVLMVRTALQIRREPFAAPLAAATVAWLFAFAGQNITQPDIMSAHGLTMLVALLSILLVQRHQPAPQTVGASLNIANWNDAYRSVSIS